MFRSGGRAGEPGIEAAVPRRSRLETMRLTNLTRRTEIGANSYLLEVAGRRVVLDCGMHPKHEGEDALPNLRAIPDGELDAIIITHAHLDHIGSLPVLMRRHPARAGLHEPADGATRRGAAA